jgi:hypothetical protein
MGEAPDVRASELLVSYRPEERSQREEAATWLREALADGPRPAKEILKEARRNGFTEVTLQRAKRDLRMQSVKTGFGKTGEWCWTLPKDDQPGSLDDQYSEVDHLRQNAGLARASDAGSASDDHVPNIDHLTGRADYDGASKTDPWGVPLERGIGVAMMRMGDNLGWRAVAEIAVGAGMLAWRRSVLTSSEEQCRLALEILEHLEDQGTLDKGEGTRCDLGLPPGR